MNILIIINSFRLGGAEKLCYDLARYLSNKDNVQVFLYSIGKVATKLEHEMFEKFEESRVKVGTFNKPYKKQRIQIALKIKRFCKENKIDIVHTNGQSPDFLMRLSKLFGNKTKVIVTIHNTSGYSRMQEKIFGRYTDAYTAVSKDALQYAKERVGITREIHLIDNGIEIEKYSNIENSNRRFDILSVGRLEPQKDYIKATEFLAPFLKKHKEVKWLIYGDYTSNLEYYSCVKKKIEELGIQKSVEFKGVITDPKAIYQHGNVFVLASAYEGFGIAFIEAIMSQHYVFSRNVGVIQDILRYGGIIHNIDDKESAEFLENIYAKRVSNQEIEKNKKIVITHYSMSNMVEKYYTVFEGVL